ncbi:MAG: polymer-forming cytoskeletal protein [Rhodospirillales bacterium]
MFRRKKDEPATPGTPGTGEGQGDLTAPPLKPFSRKGTHAPSKPPTSAAFHPEMPRRAGPEIPGLPPRRVDRALSADADSKRLLVGRDISLSGEITSCDHLVVEGRSEVVLSNARLIEVMPSGFFQGSADVEEADISGRFEGELIARDLLIVRSGGRINGTIRYGRIVIEQGGEISGNTQTLGSGDTEAPDLEPGPEEDAESVLPVTPLVAPPRPPKRKRTGPKLSAGKK